MSLSLSPLRISLGLFRGLLLVVLFHRTVNSSSFYDNPEQDPLPPSSGDATEENLEEKWGFDVNC